jgi:hypothetical protein
MTLSPPRGRALRRLLLPLGVALAAACSPEGHGPTVAGARQGIIRVYDATYEDGHGDRRFFLKEGEGETRLFFEQTPDVLPGTTVEVWGKDRDDGLHVTGMQVDETVATAKQALVNGKPYAPRTFGLVLVDIGGGVNISKDEAKKRLFGTNPGDNSVKQYYLEASYDTQDISGDILGPISYPMFGCSTTTLAAVLRPQLGQTFDHYLWYLGSQNPTCGWSGLATEGTPQSPETDTWYNASAGCVVLVQEPGHNFGMQHSSSMNCGNVPFVDVPQGNCQHNEYGDKYDPMGGGCNHMNAWQKVLEGWLQGCNAVRIKSSGTYTLLPIETQCDGAQVLQIPMPKVRAFTRSGGGGTATNEKLQYYYLELRTARGFDTTIRSTPTVLVHVGEDFRSRTQELAGRHTWILDMDPSSKTTLEGLTEGKSYTDPAGGVTFSVMSLSADQAQISVTIPNGTGGPTCFDGTPQPNPPNVTCAGIATGSMGGMGGAGGAGNGGTGGDAGSGGTGAVQPTRVEQFTLVNADTGMDIMQLTEQSTLNLDVLPPHLTARADTDPPMVGSIVLSIDNQPPQTQSMAPYTFTMKNASGNYAPWTLGVGAHTLMATPYDGPNATGTAGAALTVTFTLSSASAVSTGGAPGIAGAGGAPPVGVAGSQAVGTGGVVTGAAGSPLGTGGALAGAGGAFGFGTGGFGGVSLNAADGDGSAMSCGCRLGERSADTKDAAFVAFAAGLCLRRRRHARLRRIPHTG